MSTVTLTQAQQLIDQLSLFEQVRLLEYLTPRIRSAVDSIQTSPPPLKEEHSNGWDALFRMGNEIGKLPNINNQSMTQTLMDIRR